MEPPSDECRRPASFPSFPAAKIRARSTARLLFSVVGHRKHMETFVENCPECLLANFLDFVIPEG